MPILLILFQKKKSEEEGTHPNSFYEANITLKAKPGKHATHTKKKKENYHWQYKHKNYLKQQQQQIELN